MIPIEFELPGMKLESNANMREHWAVKAQRTKRQRTRVTPVMQAHTRGIRPLVVVTITRVSPRALDKDNLAGSCKAVQDEIAKVLRIDDGSRLIDWHYVQAKGDYAVRVRIEGTASVAERVA